MKEQITVVIADDHALLRRGVRDVLAESSRFRIVGEAGDGKEAIDLLLTLKPHVVIIDIDMPKLNGLETLRELRQFPFPIKSVILTMYKEEDMFNAAMDLGAKAYVLKENAANDIIEALNKVIQGETFVSPSMMEAGRRRGDRVRQLLLGKPQIEALTASERRILKLIGEDYTSKEIADSLHVSVRTIDNHRQNICRKLNLHGTHSLLKFAFDNSAYL